MNCIVSVSVKSDTGANSSALENCKQLKIVLPREGGELRVLCSGEEIHVGSDEVAVIAAQVKHSISGETDGMYEALIEQPLLPLKGITVIKDVAGGGIRIAAKQAAAFQNEESVLKALGELIVSYITLQTTNALSPVVAALREDIEKNMRDSVYSVEAYIRKLPLNYDYVRKLFKKETGLTPHEYLTHLRMEQAAKILLSGMSNRYSAYTVGQVAEMCGFAEPLYFSRVFKKHFGVSPTEYTKRK